MNSTRVCKQALYSAIGIVFVMLFLYGCNAPVLPEHPKATLTRTVTPEIILSTSTQIPEPTLTTARTFLTELPDFTSEPTLTQTPEPIWTPLPTLSPDEAQKMVTELLETNAGCKLPCWWGIVPGKTPWQAAQQFFVSFSDRIGQGETSESITDRATYINTNY